MIIDCHCHAGTGDLLTAPWDTSAPIKDHLERATAAGIQKTVVFPVSNSDYERANEELAKIVTEHSDRLIGFARLHAQHDKKRAEKLIETAVNNYGFRGLKIHGAEAFPGREILEVVKHYKLPMLIDIMDQSMAVEMIAESYPEVPIIVAHLGSFRNTWSVHMRTADQIATYPNVYTDTSGVRFFDCLLYALKRGGAAKILFGSDGPMLHPGNELQKIKLLKLSPDEENAVLGGTFLKLIGEHF